MIKQLSNNKFKIIIEIGYTFNGIRKRKTETITGTKKDAKIRESELLLEYSQKKIAPNCNNLTFKEYSIFFLNNYCENNIGAKTLNEYKLMINRLNEYIGNRQLKSIDVFTLTELYKKLKIGKRKSQLTNNTILHFYNLINLMFETAIKWKRLDNNPNTLVPKPKKEKKLAQCYNPEEIMILMEGLKKECLKYQALLTLAIDTGARRSEILALNWNDIDLYNKIITINKSMDVINGKFIEKPTKNTSSTRKIVLTDTTTEILKLYKEEEKSVRKNFKENNKLFLAKSGKPMYPTTCVKILHKVAKKNGLKELNFHSLRHSSASLQIALGVHTKLIQDRMGHSSTNTTMTIYSHVFQENRDEVANKLNSILSGI